MSLSDLVKAHANDSTFKLVFKPRAAATLGDVLDSSLFLFYSVVDTSPQIARLPRKLVSSSRHSRSYWSSSPILLRPCPRLGCLARSLFHRQNNPPCVISSLLLRVSSPSPSPPAPPVPPPLDHRWRLCRVAGELDSREGARVSGFHRDGRPSRELQESQRQISQSAHRGPTGEAHWQRQRRQADLPPPPGGHQGLFTISDQPLENVPLSSPLSSLLHLSSKV